MTSTKTRTTKLIAREKEFATLLGEYKSLAESVKNSQSVLKSLGEQIVEAMNKENLTSVEIDGIGVAEITQTGGSVTWDQEQLIELIKDGANLRQVDGADFMAQICKLTARPSIAKEVNLDISDAKIVGKFTDKLKVS